MPGAHLRGALELDALLLPCVVLCPTCGRYKGDTLGSNMFMNEKAELIYHVGACAVVQDIDSVSQKWFRGHSELITCICMHPNNKSVAVAQCGVHPLH